MRRIQNDEEKKTASDEDKNIKIIENKKIFIAVKLVIIAI